MEEKDFKKLNGTLSEISGSLKIITIFLYIALLLGVVKSCAGMGSTKVEITNPWAIGK